jgi:hypothetical protein
VDSVNRTHGAIWAIQLLTGNKYERAQIVAPFAAFGVANAPRAHPNLFASTPSRCNQQEEVAFHSRIHFKFLIGEAR